MNTTHETHDFPRIRIRRATRHKLKAQALRHEMTMQDYIDWLVTRDIEGHTDGIRGKTSTGISMIVSQGRKNAK